jgi:hypothetical protein
MMGDPREYSITEEEETLYKDTLIRDYDIKICDGKVR